MPFYENQITAGNEIISLFTGGDRGYRLDRGLESNDIIDRLIQLELQKSFWNVLAAEMQSGKTNTYLWVAFEMLRIGEINNIYIICGTSSKRLKEQLQNDYDDALDDYIDEMERLGINIDNRKIIKNKIKNTKKIYFSNDLSKIPELPNNTLLIWDESHYAQDVKNRPNILLNKLGIEATGKIEYLKNKNIKILSVSATGFSEISDNYHFEQSKKIVRLKNGERYIGVKKFWENGNIILFKNPLEKLNEILENHLREKRYAIVRCSNKNYIAIKQLFELYNWNVKTFNSKTNEIDSLEYLKDRPDKNTVVLINGMCRMGEKLCKEHISFVMETTKFPKTDTILQSLLGRMSGYDSNMYIQIYISENVIMTKEDDENEIVKYIKFCDGENICPSKAKNLVDNSNKWKHNIICKISSENITSTENRQDIIESVFEAIIERNLDDHNNEEYKIDEKIVTIIENNIGDVVTRNIIGRDEDGALSKTYKNVPFQIMKSYNERSPALLTDAGCTFISNERDMVNIWVFKTNEFADIGIIENDIFIDTRILNSKNIPRTTGSECFSHKLINEDQTITVMNGRQSSDLPIETSTNEEIMKEELSVRIKVSLEHSQYHRYIESAKGDDNKWIGIIVTHEIYHSIKKGYIYKHMLREHKVKLNPIKSKGRQPIYEDGKIRLIKIEW
jgi:hypothetical protein